jgi:hypothetical protein
MEPSKQTEKGKKKKKKLENGLNNTLQCRQFWALICNFS